MKQKQTLKMVMGTKGVEKHLGVKLDNDKYKKYENIFVFQKQQNTLHCCTNNISFNSLSLAS